MLKDKLGIVLASLTKVHAAHGSIRSIEAEIESRRATLIAEKRAQKHRELKKVA